MAQKGNMQKIINQINKDLDKLEIYKIDESHKNEELIIKDNEPIYREKEVSFLSNSDTSTIRSNRSQKTEMTLISQSFNKEKDLDLPYFSPTKYISFHWRLMHSLLFFFYSIFLLVSNINWLLQRQNPFILLLLISHILYFISTFQQWLYYRRGCIGDANYNSRVKTNVDKSFRAKVLRSEEGMKYFFSLVAAIILIYGNIYYFTLGNKKLDPEFWNINLIGTMIICLTQILKLEKILTKSKQYNVVNDLSLCLIEILMFFGSLLFGTSYFLQILYYNYFRAILDSIFKTLKIGGSILIIFSGLCLFHRYFFSSYDDLNTSDLSNVTI